MAELREGRWYKTSTVPDKGAAVAADGKAVVLCTFVETVTPAVLNEDGTEKEPERRAREPYVVYQNEDGHDLERSYYGNQRLTVRLPAEQAADLEYLEDADDLPRDRRLGFAPGAKLREGGL